MKRLCLLLTLLLVLPLFAAAETTDTLPVVIDSTEYMLYQNIFYNDYGTYFNGTEVTKQGVFTTIHDAFSDMTRYYVWGTLDQTMCCDWQWELQVDDPSILPANGSLVSVTGTFSSHERALDGYWIAGARVETLAEYVGETADLDMTTMSGTLERVQVLNYIYYPQVFDGQTVFAYGRVYGLNSFQDPYYDGSWIADFSSLQEVPPIGTSIVLRGVISDGVITQAVIETEEGLPIS